MKDRSFKISPKTIGVLLFCLAILLTLTFIFTNSMKSREESSEQSSVFTELLRPILDPHDKLTYEELSHIVRKLAHFSEFCLLSFECMALSYYVFGKIKLTGIIYSAAFSLLSADIDEFIQSFTGRGSSVSDVMIDFSGACTGIAISCLACVLADKLVHHIKSKKLS